MGNELIFDFPQFAVPGADGLVAVGGNLSPGTLINAYKKGIFPWYNEGETIYWYSPGPRFVLLPSQVHTSHSMRTLINQRVFSFTVDCAFGQVIGKCRNTVRAGQKQSWISDEIESAYKILFQQGIAHSAEAWYDGKLAGGLYGVLLGKVFFGESMFAEKSNASKFALISWAQILKQKGIELIDCQMYTPHLASLGATAIPLAEFQHRLKTLIG